MDVNWRVKYLNTRRKWCTKTSRYFYIVLLRFNSAGWTGYYNNSKKYLIITKIILHSKKFDWSRHENILWHQNILMSQNILTIRKIFTVENAWVKKILNHQNILAVQKILTSKYSNGVFCETVVHFFTFWEKVNSRFFTVFEDFFITWHVDMFWLGCEGKTCYSKYFL